MGGRVRLLPVLKDEQPGNKCDFGQDLRGADNIAGLTADLGRCKAAEADCHDERQADGRDGRRGSEAGQQQQ